MKMANTVAIVETLDRAVRLVRDEANRTPVNRAIVSATWGRAQAVYELLGQDAKDACWIRSVVGPIRG